MGKLHDRLTAQLKTEYKEDAELCLKIYNKLKDISDGHVWESQWNPLVTVKFIGEYPYTRRYYPTHIGRIFLRGIENI